MRVPDPESVFGFKPGTDRMLIDYEQLIDYVETVAAASPRVAVHGDRSDNPGSTHEAGLHLVGRKPRTVG